MIRTIELCKKEIELWQVRWNTPYANTLKLNTDGRAFSNPGKIGGGSILSDLTGSLVYAFSIPCRNCTNNQAETLAAMHGIEWCMQHGYRRIVLEVDSELLTKRLSHTLKPPWQLQQCVKDLTNLIKQLDFFSCHQIFRKANSTADLLSKRSHKSDVVQHYYTFQQLPAIVKGSYLLEKYESIISEERS
ncbi:uncharacterized protein LOC107016533 [Solanum pennellii]|uniref:Uncharacterized protein LOC107016533 n=1 Tax=Solanum pennellii TaxID=28526 RepID=A0ABM1GKS2_SOLPN|nr:uncharacterized protein LOC107016533 [Solanum pennellii]